MNPVEEDRALDGEDDPAFDSRRGREAMDPATRQLAFLASGIGLLLVVVIGGWVLAGQHSGTIPVIDAPLGPVRVKPIDPGGMQAMGAQALPPESAAGTETLAPLPEAAEPQALQAQIDAARQPTGQRNAASKAPLPLAPPLAPLRAPTPDTKPEPVQTDPAQLAPAVQNPPPGPLLHTQAVPNASNGGRLAVQLAALDTHAAAQVEWTRLARSHPALFAGHAPEVESTDHDGRTIYRLRMGGFASAAAATAFCEQARAQRVACTLADF